VWARPAPGARRPRYTREQIAAAALALADAEGIEAVSMRRVAAELGAGTMTLYHYVQTKDDLLALMQDAVIAELIVPEAELAVGWREALIQLAERSRATLRRHPWAISFPHALLGPNGLRHVEQSLAAVAGMPLSVSERVEVISLVDDYTLGFVLGDDLRSMLEEPWLPSLSDYLEGQLESGALPHLGALLAGEEPASALRRLAAAGGAEERFRRGLTRLLDGVALMLEGSSPGVPAAAGDDAAS